MRRVALVLAGVALAGVAAAAALAYLASAHSDRLLAAVGSGLGREVRAERLGFTLIGGAGVTLSGVEIADDPALGAREPFISSRSLELRLRVLPLLRRRVVVDRIVIEEPAINLVRDASGQMNAASLGKRGKDGTPGEPAAEAGTPQRPAFQLASLRLRHGTIRYSERASGRSVELSDVSVDARQPRFDAPIPLSLRARLVTKDLRLDDIVSEGVLELAGERPTYRGTLTAGPGAVGPIAVERLAAKVRAAPPVIELESATAETLGGSVSGTALVTSEGKDAGLVARLEVRDLDLAALPARQDRPRPAGRLGMRASLAAPPPGSAGFQNRATGQGDFGVTEGRIEGAGFGRPVLDVLQPFMKPGLAGRLRERYPDLFASDDLSFTRLSGSGRLAGGRIRSDDLVLAATSWEARGEGSLGIAGDVEATLRMALAPALTDDLLGQSKARPALVDSGGRLTIPLRVHGPVRRPRVTPDPSFAATAARGLLGGGGLGEAAGQALERFFGGRRKRDR